MVEVEKIEEGLANTIRSIALFVGMGDGHISEDEMEWLDQWAPGLIRHCLASRPALEALFSGRDIDEVKGMIPRTVEHSLSVGMMFGGPPTWAEEALEKRAASGDIGAYEVQFAQQIDNPVDQMIAHYFARRMLYFSGSPAEGELKAYLFMLAGWIGAELDEEIIDSLTASANTILPMLFGLPPADDGTNAQEFDAE